VANTANQGYVPAQHWIAVLLANYKKAPDQFTGLKENILKQILILVENRGSDPQSSAASQFQRDLVELKSDDEDQALLYFGCVA
jgi:hypothetical protein